MANKKICRKKQVWLYQKFLRDNEPKLIFKKRDKLEVHPPEKYIKEIVKECFLKFIFKLIFILLILLIVISIKTLV